MNICNNIYQYTLTALFITLILMITSSSMIILDKEFSETENRMLQQRPLITFKNLINGKVSTEYEKYICDQIVMRDFWISCNAEFQRFIGKRSNNDIYLGRSGYLLQRFLQPNIENTEKKIKAINDFALTNYNIKTYFMLVPDSVKIMESKLPPFAQSVDQMEYINVVQDNLSNNINFVDVYDTLIYRNHQDIFYKTDHHWTSKGAYYAYDKLSYSMGFDSYKKEDFNIEQVTDEFYGSLYSKSGFRRLEADSIELYIPKENISYDVYYYDKNRNTQSIYEMDNINKKDKYTVFLDGNHSLIRINTKNENMRKLLVVKDSFANALIPFLTTHYSEIYVVDLRYFNDSISEFIKNNNIQETLILYSANTFFEDTSINRISW